MSVYLKVSVSDNKGTLKNISILGEVIKVKTYQDGYRFRRIYGRQTPDKGIEVSIDILEAAFLVGKEISNYIETTLRNVLKNFEAIKVSLEVNMAEKLLEGAKVVIRDFREDFGL